MDYLDIPYFKQDTKYTCGPASLQMVLAYYGIRESEAKLAKELGTRPDNGTRRKAMIRAVRRRGLYCYENEDTSLEEVRYLFGYKVPIIIRFIETSEGVDHYGVISGVSDKEIAIHDPWNGERLCLGHKNFLARWRCDVIGNCNRWIMAVRDEKFPFGTLYQPLT